MADGTLIRPIGVVLDGRLELGLELVLFESRVMELRPHTGVPELFVVSPAFVNAHSHLEYRNVRLDPGERDFFRWLEALLPHKRSLEEAAAAEAADQAALENAAGGVAFVAEHSDLPVSVPALLKAGLGGIVFQETITFREWTNPQERLRQVRDRARSQQGCQERIRVCPSPHAPYTVDPDTLRAFGATDGPLSIHVAESVYERMWLTAGEGPFAEMHARAGNPQPRARSSVEYLHDLGLCRPGVQWVHCCDVDEQDLELMALGGVSVAHCPRSNWTLGCPTAPIRRMLRAGLRVGLGTDSAASAGPPHLFAEMRRALQSSEDMGEPIAPEDVWRMATRLGAESLGIDGWELNLGNRVPLIALHLPEARTTEDLIRDGSPEVVEWLVKPSEIA
ncbi:MAG: amidohydrolase family protein [Fimbriimonadales bacterium]